MMTHPLFPNILVYLEGIDAVYLNSFKSEDLFMSTVKERKPAVELAAMAAVPVQEGC